LHRFILKSLFFFTALLFPVSSIVASSGTKVFVGADRIFNGDYDHLLKGKRIGLITNHTGINSELEKTTDLFFRYSIQKGFRLSALFAPEHGIEGSSHADEIIVNSSRGSIPVFSLHGRTKRPTKEMLDNVDTLVFDIQDVGTRSYTYITTLFYSMEEAAKEKKQIIILDRPNPINGTTVDGPMLKEKWRSFVGYINVPYCHGMTVGELARYFNEEYKVGCNLVVVPMKGWKRTMSFSQTGLIWIPTSPHIPEATTVPCYPATGILGELPFVSIGIGYTLPFKVVGAPWIDAQLFAKLLNAQNFPGVMFVPFHFKPFYGIFSHQECHGILIVVTDQNRFRPVCTQFLIIGALKSLYPERFDQAMRKAAKRKEMFCKVNGTEEIWQLMMKEKYIIWKLRCIDKKERENFLSTRQKYLFPEYSE